MKESRLRIKKAQSMRIKLFPLLIQIQFNEMV